MNCEHNWIMTTCGERCSDCGECKNEQEGHLCRYLKTQGRTSTSKVWICVKKNKETLEATSNVFDDAIQNGRGFMQVSTKEQTYLSKDEVIKPIEFPHKP